MTDATSIARKKARAASDEGLLDVRPEGKDATNTRIMAKGMQFVPSKVRCSAAHTMLYPPHPSFHSTPFRSLVACQFTYIGPAKLFPAPLKSELFKDGKLSKIIETSERKYASKRAVEEAYWHMGAPFSGISPSAYGFASEKRARLGPF